MNGGKALTFGLPLASALLAGVFVVAAPGSNTVWYLIRAAGVVSYALVTVTVIGGLLVSNRAVPAGQPRADVFDVHRFLSLLTIASVGLHVLTLLLDEYIGFSPRQVLVPFTSEYRPAAVALGILALYGLIAVYGSFYIKSWIGHRGWRAIHYGTFGVFALATYHGILSGTDTGEPWMVGLYLAAVVSVLGLLIYRFVRVAEPDSAGRTEPRPTPSPRLSLHGSVTTFDSAKAAESSWRRPAPEPGPTSGR